VCEVYKELIVEKAREVYLEHERERPGINYSTRRGVAFEQAYIRLVADLSSSQKDELLRIGLTAEVKPSSVASTDLGTIDTIVAATLKHINNTYRSADSPRILLF
jgi:hypothetical protein